MTTHTLADLDGTDDAATWIQAGHVLDESEARFLRALPHMPAALVAFVNTWDAYTIGDLAEHLTYSEAEALAALVAAGKDDPAAGLSTMSSWAAGDSEWSEWAPNLYSAWVKSDPAAWDAARLMTGAPDAAAVKAAAEAEAL